jgi:hypothetical protein
MPGSPNRTHYWNCRYRFVTRQETTLFSLHSPARSARPKALALTAAALIALLAACDSQSPGKDTPPDAPGAGSQADAPGAGAQADAPGAPGAPHGDLRLSSAETGKLTLTSNKCTFAKGKPTGFDGATTSGSVSGSASGSAWKVHLTTNTRPAGYTGDGLNGVSTKQQGNMWKVTLADVKLAATDQPSKILQVSGTVICSGS